jgi:UDP:flavonoid glycosyltransferase YjiC (YdhE family)
LRAGVPTVVVPSFGDQFLWGWRVGQLGAGPKPISRKELTAARSASGIQQAIDDEVMRQRTAQIGAQLRAEDGVETAVRLIEAFAWDGRL